MKDANDRGYIEVDKSKCQYIKRAFKYYATGMYSLKSLGEKMYLEGFKDKYGNPYRARKFEQILKNIFYIGDFIWKGQRYKGVHIPIIDKKLFYQVQAKFGLTNKPPKNDKNFAYTKLITCKVCGCFLTADSHKGAHNSGIYTYYRCTNRKNSHASLRGLTIRDYALDDAFKNIFGALEIPSEIFLILKKQIFNNLDELYKVENLLLEQKSNRIKELETLIHRSYEDKLLGKLPTAYTEELFLIQNNKWQKEKDLLQLDLENTKEISQSLYKNIDLLLTFLNKLPYLFEVASVNDKRVLVRMMVEQVEFSNGKLEVRLKPIFEYLRQIKNVSIYHLNTEKVRTLKKPLNREVLEYLNEQIALIVNSKVRTLETRIIPNKKAPEGANLLNGAPGGIRTHAYRNHNPRS